MAKVMQAVGVAVLAVLKIAVVATVLSGSELSAKGVSGISLDAADAFHERFNDECNRVECSALYRGVLARRLISGVTPPLSDSGRWDVYPIDSISRDKIISDGANILAPHLLTVKDRCFWVQVTSQPASDSISLIVRGEKIAVSIHDVKKGLHFALSPKTTPRSLVERCSDRYWNEKNGGNKGNGHQTWRH